MAETEQERFLKMWKRMRDDPVFFARVILDFRPYPYQEELLRSKAKRIVGRWGRQSGKTTCIAIKVIHFTYTNPKKCVLIVSRGLRQSMIMFRVIRNMIFSAPILRKSVIRSTNTMIILRNGSTIHALPCSQEGANLRGFTAHMVILDEAAFISDTVIMNVIFPMIACVSEDTLMILPNGKRRKASTVYNTRSTHLFGTSKDNFSIGEHVEFEQAKIVQKRDNGIQDCYELKIEDGRRITVTENHPFLRGSDNHPYRQQSKWVQTKNLKIGNKIAVPCRIKVEGKILPEMWEPIFIAYMIADGTISSDQVIWSKTEQKLIDDFESILRAGYILNPRPRKQFTVTHGVPHRHNYYIDYLRRIKLWQTRKYIPDTVFTWQNIAVALFLNRLFGSDGSFIGKAFRFEQKEEDVVRGVFHLLLRFGIHGRIWQEKSGHWILDIAGKENIKRLRIIGVFNKEEELKMLWNSVRNVKKPRKRQGDIVWLRIKSKNYIGRQRTLDFETEGHTFLADDIWSHNTTDGTVVMISTPWGKDSMFYRCAVNPAYFSQHVRSSDCPRIPQKFLDEQRRQIGELRYQIEYEAEFQEDMTAFFTQDMIKQVTEDYEVLLTHHIHETSKFTDGDYYLGCDFGKKVDHSVVVLFRYEAGDDRFRLVHVKQFRLRTRYTRVRKYIKLLYDKFPIVWGCVDQTSVGEPQIEIMQDEIPHIEGIPLYSAHAKQDVMMRTYWLMEKKRMWIPFDHPQYGREIITQFNEQQYNYSRVRGRIAVEEHGVMTFSHPEARHDDILWACVLGLYATREFDSESGSRGVVR